MTPPYPQSILGVFSDILDIDNLAGWIELREDNPGLAGELLLKNAENYSIFLAKSLNTSSVTSLTLSKENIGNCSHDCAHKHANINDECAVFRSVLHTMVLELIHSPESCCLTSWRVQ